MPIVDVEIVSESGTLRDGLARALADAFGELFGSGPAQTWVRLRALPRSGYAENETDAPPGADAVFVTILKRALPAHDALAREAALVAETVARVCQRPPQHVHVLYEPPGAGRIAFGGTLLPSEP